MSGVLQAVFQNLRSFGIGAPYWIGMLGNTSNGRGQGVTADSDGNMYVVGFSYIGGSNNVQLAKYDKTGAIQWQKSLNGAAGDVGLAIALDSTGNIYITGYTYSGNNNIQIAKYNNSGTIQWQRSLDSSGANDVGYGIAVDSSANVYIVGQSRPYGPSNIQIAKYDTSGTIQWQRVLVGGTDTGNGIAIDSSNNVYIVGQSNGSPTGTQDWIIAKYNSSGVIQWQRYVSDPDTGYTDAAQGVAVDSSGNVYVAGSIVASGGGLPNIGLVKYNSSGTLQWQRSLSSSSNDIATGVAVDQSGNVYIAGSTNTSGTYDFIIAKYNGSGTLQWQRGLGGSGAERAAAISVDSSGNVYVNGYGDDANPITQFLFAKLPSDGSLTGTYTVNSVSMDYYVSSLTDSALSSTYGSSSLSDSASSLSDNATTFTSSTTSLTSSVTTL